MLTLRDAETVQGSFRLRADVQVSKGGRVSIIGPSGSGKSTLLNVIAGFISLDKGTLEIAGEDVGETAPGARPALRHSLLGGRMRLVVLVHRGQSARMTCGTWLANALTGQ